MKLTLLLISASILHVNVFGASSDEEITIKKNNASLETVFREIEKQCAYRFFFNETLMKQAVPVTIDVKGVSLEKALDACFEKQPVLTYAIVEQTIIVKRKEVREAEVLMAGMDRGRLAEVRGVVTSEGGPVAGATVSVKGKTNKVTSTNTKGEFFLHDVDDNDVLIISSVSHFEREFKLNGKSIVTISLQEKIGELDDQIVVAYNTSTKKTNVGSVTVVKGDAIRDLPSRSVDKSLQGFVPGLLVTSGTGQPGGGLANFVLRGISTGDDGTRGSTLRNPLVIVDGIPVSQDPQQLGIAVEDVPFTNPMAQLNPSDIETITVLKDAAAIALYGSKAANGVILITTKKGKLGKTQFSFRHQTDLARRLKGKVKLLNQEQYLEILYESYRNSRPGITDEAILAELKTIFPTRADGSFYPEDNLLEHIYKKNAYTISNEFSIAEGNERSNFYFNAEWTKQEGIFKKGGYDRKSLRFNFESKPIHWFTFGLNLGLSYNVQEYPDISNDPNVIAMMSSPLQPIKDENGNYFEYYPYLYKATNPVAALEYNSNKNISYRVLSKLFSGLTFLRHFKLSASLGMDFGLTEAKEKYDPRLFDPVSFTTGLGRIEEASLRNISVISTNILNYHQTFNQKHNVNALAGQEAQIITQRNIRSIGSNFTLPYYDQVDNAPVRSAYGNSVKQTLVSYFGQVNYNYLNKYFVSFSSRMDGSSKFGKDQQFGCFWSSGIGWNVIEEGFMKNFRPAVNFLKLRGSLGVAGNSGAINRYTKYDRLQANQFLNNIAVYPGSSPANPNIKWEETFSWDLGLEGRFWNNRITFTADIYKRKTSDLIYLINLGPATGFVNMLANIGDMQNKGTELSLSIDIITNRNFKWNINGNWSANANKLLRADVNLSTLTAGFLANGVGRSFNSFYIRRWAGVNPENGAALYLDSTGLPNSDYNAAKPEFVGKPQPDAFGAVASSITYKQWTASIRLYFQYGFQVYDNYILTADGSEPYINQDIRALDRWKKPGDVAANPIRTLYSPHGYGISTRRLYDGDFIRLQNITLNYNLSGAIINQLRLKKINVYIQAHNVAIWTKFPGNDVNNTNVAGNSTFNYPSSTSYSLGVKIDF